MIIKNSDLIIERHTKIKDNSEINLLMNDDYLHKITISTINITQLPMLIVPNKGVNDKYFPYLTPEISHIYNSFDTIIKNKYDNMYNTECQVNISNTITYLNSIKFKINVDFLNYISSEWNNLDSLLFKGENKLKEFNKDMKIEDKRLIESHNSKYFYIKNTINIAILYSNVTFYLPTFADFRGRIYPLSQYLSYQGSDIARALLLFDNNESINNQGIDYLKIYLANLGGQSYKS